LKEVPESESPYMPPCLTLKVVSLKAIEISLYAFGKLYKKKGSSKFDEAPSVDADKPCGISRSEMLLHAQKQEAEQSKEALDVEAAAGSTLSKDKSLGSETAAPGINPQRLVHMSCMNTTLQTP